MPTKFDDFFSEIEAEAKQEGPVAIQELEELQKHFSERRKALLALLDKE